MSFARARTQVLTRYMPGALFVHDAYGVCQVTAVDLDPVDGINDVALGEALREYLGQWDAPLRAGYVLDLTVDLRRLFIVGAPARVRFAPYPELLQCTRCARVAPLARLRGGPPGVCPACGGGMRQIPFVESHACGRLEPLSTPLCPVHGATDLVLETTGRYRSVTWRCLACGNCKLQPSSRHFSSFKTDIGFGQERGGASGGSPARRDDSASKSAAMASKRACVTVAEPPR
ncbi:MAG: hypothetical protein WCG26_02725 [Chloroflexales bacterium]